METYSPDFSPLVPLVNTGAEDYLHASCVTYVSLQMCNQSIFTGPTIYKRSGRTEIKRDLIASANGRRNAMLHIGDVRTSDRVFSESVPWSTVVSLKVSELAFELLYEFEWVEHIYFRLDF